MAIIYATTLVPSKLELLTAWLPTRPWYVETGQPPRLAKVGGFRLDDPGGEVGLEFMLVADAASATTYHVPVTYRAAAQPAVEAALIGTTEHGVLGHRFVYDGAHDPVLVGQLLALVQGQAAPQAQSVTATPDPTVGRHPVGDAGALAVTAFSIVADRDAMTDLRLDAAASDGRSVALLMRINRVLAGGPRDPASGCVTLPYQRPDGSQGEATVVTVTRRP